MITKKCKKCKKDFKSFKSRNRKFCSRKCSAYFNVNTFKKGHKRTQLSNHGQWKGGVAKHSSGYLYKLSPDHPLKDVRGYVLMHRLKMEKKIGRYLEKQEVVHHINGVKDDNRLCNLKLHKNQSSHAREEYYLSDKIQKAFKANQITS